MIKLSSDKSYLVMKVILWWKFSSDESYLVMKFKIVKEVKRSDVLWRFACGDVFMLLLYCWWQKVLLAINLRMRMIPLGGCRHAWRGDFPKIGDWHHKPNATRCCSLNTNQMSLGQSRKWPVWCQKSSSIELCFYTRWQLTSIQADGLNTWVRFHV